MENCYYYALQNVFGLALCDNWQHRISCMRAKIELVALLFNEDDHENDVWRSTTDMANAA